MSLSRWRISPLHLLLFICVVAGAVRIYLVADRPLNYDEYWHLFIAQQDTREGLAREWRLSGHPPLYYWLLRIPVSLARGPLLDRSISLLAGVLAVWVIGRILAKMAKDTMVAPLGAFAFALAPSAVFISSEVRSYMLCTLFLLVAFGEYVRLVEGPPSFQGLAIFSGASCLALVSHYFTVFFLAAALAVAVWIAAARLSAGKRHALRGRWVAAAAAAALPILGVGTFLYREHLRGQAGRQDHLSSFYYRPESGESLLHYLVGALWNAFNLFAPIPVGPSGAPAVFAVCLTLLAGALIYLFSVRWRAESAVRALPLAFLMVLAVALLAASVRGAYPFGGSLRQQFILFPFLLLTGFMLLDSMLSKRPRLRQPLIAIVLLGVCVNSGLGLPRMLAHTRSSFEGMFAREMSLHQAAFPDPGAVYLDQFSLIVFFAHHDRWRWRSLDANTYGVTRDGREVVVMLDERRRWNLDTLDAVLYEDLSRRLSSLRLRSTTVFSIRYPFPTRPQTLAERETIRLEVPALAALAHLEMDRLILDGFNVFAQFVVREAVPAGPR
jgi:hypothetical protein